MMPAQAVRTTTASEAHDNAVHADDMPKEPERRVVDQRAADAKALQTATDDGMAGGDRPTRTNVSAVQTNRDGSAPSAEDAADTERPAAPIVVTADAARGALGASKVPFGGTLLPMLIGGLVLAVVSLTAIMMIG